MIDQADIHRKSLSDKVEDRNEAVRQLNDTFAALPDKDAAWESLVCLSRDYENDVRVSANYSLARASIFKATESEDEESFRIKLEKSVEFFERSAAEAKYSNPAKFCLPFYRSFYVLTFKKEDTEAEVQKCISEAKSASEGSKSKEELLEAIENLSNALKEAEKEWDLGTMKCDLSACKRYCDRAGELLKDTKEKAPGATKVIRKGLPVISRRIKSILQEIEDESSRLCKVSRHTPLEPLARGIHEGTCGLAGVEYSADAESMMDRLVPDVRTMCSFLHEKTQESVCELKNWDKLDFLSKAQLFERAISKCSVQMENLSNEIKDRDNQIEFLRNEVVARLGVINYSIFRIKICSADASDSIRALKCELDKVKGIKSKIDRLDLKMEYLNLSQQDVLKTLKEEMPRIILDLENVARGRGDKKFAEVRERLEELRDELKGSSMEKVLDVAAKLATILGTLILFL